MRKECIANIERFAGYLQDIKTVLDVGIAGDVKPGGNYYLWPLPGYKTMDIDSRYNPDFVDDICNPQNTPEESFDLVIVSNTLEHTWEPYEGILGAKKLCKSGGHIILDCPWLYPYHAEDDFPDCWRISEDGMKHLIAKAGLELIFVNRNEITSVLARKP